MQVAPLVQIPVFLILFLAPVYVPLDLLEGWIATAAGVNPATVLVEAGRGLLAGRPDETLLAFAVGAAGVLLLGVFALRGLRRAERAV
jgi:ABC-2 type transport system permease protein